MTDEKDKDGVSKEEQTTDKQESQETTRAFVFNRADMTKGISLKCHFCGFVFDVPTEKFKSYTYTTHTPFECILKKDMRCPCCGRLHKHDKPILAAFSELTQADYEEKNAPSNDGTKSTTSARSIIIFAIIAALIGGSILLQIPYKERVKEKAVSYGLEDVSVKLGYDLGGGWWNAVIECSNFGDFSHPKQIEIAQGIDQLRKINVDYFFSNGARYKVYTSTRSIYKNGKNVYDDYYNSELYVHNTPTYNTADTNQSSEQSGREIDAWVCAQDIVRGSLKAPSTAKFCSYPAATVTYNGGSDYTVKGYVDAENSYGAETRNNFTVTLTLTEKGYKNGLVTFN